jgi:hypothetical protein
MAKKTKKKNRLAVPVGIIALIFAVIGIITVINFASDAIKNISDNTAEKLEYEKMLKPVVMFDPDPFDDLTQADISQLLNSAVWSLLMSEEGTEQYPYSEGEVFGIVVPQADIEKHFVRLFGNEIDIASLHSSIDMSVYDITYDAALKSYILPITGIESAYTPKVYEIEEKGSSVILSVGYINNKAWAQVADDGYTTPEPDKYMKITLRERSGGMYVASIQAVDGQEVIGSMPATRAPEIETTTEPLPTQPEILTTAVPVTDEDGEEVTDDNGELLTEIVTVIQEVTTEEAASGEDITEENTTEED